MNINSENISNKEKRKRHLEFSGDRSRRQTSSAVKSFRLSSVACAFIADVAVPLTEPIELLFLIVAPSLLWLLRTSLASVAFIRFSSLPSLSLNFLLRRIIFSSKSLQSCTWKTNFASSDPVQQIDKQICSKNKASK